MKKDEKERKFVFADNHIFIEIKTPKKDETYSQPFKTMFVRN